MNGLALMKSINGPEGYSTKLRLSESDLCTLRQMIQIQWLYRLQLLAPKHIQQFDELGIEEYHKLSHLIDHSNAWAKNSRVFPKEAIPIIRKMDFFKKLELELGEFHIADEERFGWENVYWRLVRPGNNDYGSLHADKWFWDTGVNGAIPNFPHERLKLWVAIYTMPGKNGILIAPGSHIKKDWKWHAEVLYNLPKPVFDDSEESLDLTLLPLAAGETVLFHDELIHGGAANLADMTRVSLEFTLLVPTLARQKVSIPTTPVDCYNE